MGWHYDLYRFEHPDMRPGSPESRQHGFYEDLISAECTGSGVGCHGVPTLQIYLQDIGCREPRVVVVGARDSKCDEICGTWVGGQSQPVRGPVLGA